MEENCKRTVFLDISIYLFHEMMEIWLVMDYWHGVEVIKRHLFSVDRKFQNT